MPAGTSFAISDAVGNQAATISKAGLRSSGNDLRPAVPPTVRNPSYPDAQTHSCEQSEKLAALVFNSHPESAISVSVTGTAHAAI